MLPQTSIVTRITSARKVRRQVVGCTDASPSIVKNDPGSADNTDIFARADTLERQPISGLERPEIILGMRGGSVRLMWNGFNVEIGMGSFKRGQAICESVASSFPS